MKRRLAELPLHGGKAPPWLFARMMRLAGAITMAVVDEYGPMDMLRRLSDPWWFQAFGCVLGFDWHSSGITTVTCGAMKEAFKRYGDDMGIVVAGGKGGASRRTPREIDEHANRMSLNGGDQLIHASRMSAKVDSAAVQDGYQVYQHAFFFTPAGQWCVVQQGMNASRGWARRYHWLGESVEDFVCEPHQGIHDLSDGARPRGTARAADPKQPSLLNMVASEADANRVGCAELVRDDPHRIIDELDRLSAGPTLFAPAHHPVLPADINADRLRRIVRTAHEQHPTDFEALLGTSQVGPATVRSLSLLAELIYDAPASHRDPARSRDDPADERRWADYSYAHGGKDGSPFPVDRDTYDRNIHVLLDAIRKARLGEPEKRDAMKRLATVSAGHA